MTIINNFHLEEDILLVELTGKFSLLNAKSSFIAILEEATKNKIEKIIIDTTNVKEITRSKNEAIDYGNFIADQTLTLASKRLLSKTKIAYIYLEEEKDSLIMGEMAAEIRGLKAKAFLNKSQAVIWLNKH